MNTNMFHEHRLIHYTFEKAPAPSEKKGELWKDDVLKNTDTYLATLFDKEVQRILELRITDMTTIISKGDNDLYAYTQRGRTYLRLGKEKMALPDLQKALDLSEGVAPGTILSSGITSRTFHNNESKALLSQIGECLRLMGDNNGALQYHEACFKMQTTEKDNPEYYYRRGMARINSDAYEAENDFHAMLRLYENQYLHGQYFLDPRPYQALAALARKNNNNDQAFIYENTAERLAQDLRRQKAERMHDQK